MNKPTVVIYVKPKSDQTELLDKFLAKHINQLNNHFFIRRIRVTPENINNIKNMGILFLPTMIYNGKKYTSLDQITKVLTPPNQQKSNYGYGNTSPDDLVSQFQSLIINDKTDEDEEEEYGTNRENEIRQKMAALQRRRPEMLDVNEKTKINGGRKIVAKQPTNTNFNTDDEFRKASGKDDFETPSRRYFEEEDGDLILEQDRLNLALQEGKKVGRVVSKKR